MYYTIKNAYYDKASQPSIDTVVLHSLVFSFISVRGERGVQSYGQG